MPPKPKTSPKRPKAKRASATAESKSVAQANLRAARLIEMLLKRLEEEVQLESDKTSPQWKRLFGTTQSAVVNVQKLVAALGALPQVQAIAENEGNVPPEVPMTREELAILRDWLNATAG